MSSIPQLLGLRPAIWTTCGHVGDHANSLTLSSSQNWLRIMILMMLVMMITMMTMMARMVTMMLMVIVVMMM